MRRRTALQGLLATGLLKPALAASADATAASPASVPAVLLSSLDELRAHAARDAVVAKLRPGVYTLDTAESHRFIRFTGKNSRFDLRGVTIRVDTRLFQRFGVPSGPEGFYCVLDMVGEGVVVEGVRIETFGDLPGIQSKNKIVNVVAPNAVLRDVDITTAGSAPWGYGSLFGISGGAVRKMNGIRVGWPASNAKLIGCRVHMRAMGHAIFVQGATGTHIEDCHVDGLLRTTDDVLRERSGFAFDRGFMTPGKGYVEGVHVGTDGRILPGEMIALSEDGIRLYSRYLGHDTGPTVIRACSVQRMRRGICTGLGPGADHVSDCEVLDCVAAGFNIGAGDVLENCRANARYAEALSCPYDTSSGARVDLEILDSRAGLGNTLLAVINGRDHVVRLHARQAAFVPEGFVIATGSRRGYAFYEKTVSPARGLRLDNHTRASTVAGDTAS